MTLRSPHVRIARLGAITCAGFPKGEGVDHDAKISLFDGAIDVETPEVLVYEPKNGKLHLVAAEYVIPAPAWDPTHDPFDKPQLMGHLLQFAPGPNRYGPQRNLRAPRLGLAGEP